MRLSDTPESIRRAVTEAELEAMAARSRARRDEAARSLRDEYLVAGVSDGIVTLVAGDLMIRHAHRDLNAERDR